MIRLITQLLLFPINMANINWKTFGLRMCFRRLHYYCISLSSKIRYQLKFQVYIPQVIVLHLQKATFQKTGFSRNVSQDETSCWELGINLQTTKFEVNRSCSSWWLTIDLANTCTSKYWMGWRKVWKFLFQIWRRIIFWFKLIHVFISTSDSTGYLTMVTIINL